MQARRVVAALFIVTAGVSSGSSGQATSRVENVTASLVGTWRLVLADDRPDTKSKWVHTYGEHPKGYLAYDRMGHMFLQIANDPPTPPFASGDDDKPTAHEAETAYANYAAYFGTYSVDAVRHVVTHHVEGSLEPSYTGTDQERPYKLQGDTLELTDGQTWRRVWVRVAT